ncbi:MAG TPA: hypothetical protein VFH27_07760 [Longimicrobiaceae bacterium]|nr:hypothetical protein [Longimicrobiaceae bacterium]
MNATHSTTELTPQQMADIDGGTEGVVARPVVDPVTGETIYIGCTDPMPRPF